MSTLHQSITTIDIADTTDDSGRNLMHQTNDEIHIRENAKFTQRDPDFENSDVGHDEEHLEAPGFTILAVNVAKKILLFVRAKIYSKVIHGLGLALHLSHLTETIQNNEESSIVVIK